MNYKRFPSEVSKDFVGKELTVYGIVIHIRELGKKKFLLISDGKAILQIVYEGDLKVKRGEAIKIVGNVFEDQRAIGSIEIRAKEIHKLSEIKEESLDQWSIVRMQRDKKIKHRALTLRLPQFMKVFETYANVVEYLREFCIKNGLLEIFTPKIVVMGTESGAQVFSVLYYDKDAYLAQSPQLYKQMLMASGIKGVFEVGSYYRAEVSFTNRHLSEFRGFDVELNYVEDYNEVMDFLEDMIKYVLEKLGYKIDKKIPRITFEEAKKILSEKFGKRVKEDLDTESERLIGEFVKKELDCDFVFITDFLYDAKPFYVMRKEDNPKFSYSFDLLFKGMEICSGAKREHRYEILVKQIKDKGVNPERLKYYLEAFKNGIPPHGGFGLGIDRFVKQLLDASDIRDVVLFPRDPNTLEP